MTWVSPSATTLPGPLAMAMLRDAHNASRSGLGLLVLEGCGPGPWAARRHRLRRCLLTSGFTVVWLLRYFTVVMYGPVDPGLRPILSPHRAPCRSTAPTLQFLY